jgi:hypothetical protein
VPPASKLPREEDEYSPRLGSPRARSDDGAVPTYAASTALPYPHQERAVAGLRAQLRYLLAPGETADWAMLTVTGPNEVPDARGHVWFTYTAEVTTGTD